jgi:L-rhamnose mutarotase
MLAVENRNLKEATMTNRKAFVMTLKPGCAAEYKRRHDAIWPEISDLLRKTGIRDYSIFLDEHTNTLFAVQKLEGDAGSQDLSHSPVVQRWWAFMSDIMATNPDHSPLSRELVEVFHLD